LTDITFAEHNQQDAAARLAAGTSNGLTNTDAVCASFELLMMDAKTRLKHVERLTKNK